MPEIFYPASLIPGLREDYMADVEGLTSDEIPIRPERFVTELRKAMPEDGIVVCDPGTPTPFLAAYYTLPRAGRWFVTNRAHGALGYSLSASVGAHYAHPDKKIVAVMGDGSFGFTCGELETLYRYQIPVVLVVVANGNYGWIKAGQKIMGGKYFSVDFTMADHTKIAEAFNARTRTVEKLRERLVVQGFEIALNGKKRETPPREPKLDGEGEAKLIAMRLGQPPEGYGRWTLQLLADELIALDIVEHICAETVRQTLKKIE